MRLLGRGEIQADRIDAIALARGRRPVRKHMALMRPAACADDLGADHPIAGVLDIFEVIGAERLGEARPTRSAFEFRAAFEQGNPAQPAREDAGTLLIEEYAAKRRFGAM